MTDKPMPKFGFTNEPYEDGQPYIILVPQCTGIPLDRLSGIFPPEYAAHLCKAANAYDDQQRIIGELVGALQEIAEGKGRYSLDHFEHARNTIEDMKEKANAAVASAKQYLEREKTP